MAAQRTAPASAASSRLRPTWVSVAYLTVWGYILYGIGNATPYLRTDLRLTDFEAGLHASALAIGVVSAGATADAIARRLPSGGLLDVAVASLVSGIAFVVLAPVLPISLLGAFLIGVGGGALGTQANVQLIRSSGDDSRRVMAEAAAVSMLAAGAAPLALGLAASGLHAWRVAMIVPVVPFLVLTAIRPRDSVRTEAVRMRRASLPGPYWFMWLLLVLGVSIEFSFVFWGSTMVGRQTGVSDADSSLLASLFVAGMFAGRAAIGRGLGGQRSPRLVLSTGLLVVVVGASLVWASSAPALSALGLFLGGAGTAGLWPVGLAVALRSAPKAQLEGSARATFASGVAVFAAPSALGLLADEVGVVSAWPIIGVLAAAALVVLAVAPRSREETSGERRPTQPS